MTDTTLFLAWQDKRLTRQWFPVGRLDVQPNPSIYRFRYIKGAERARQMAGFEALLDFPDLNGDYQSSELFPLFKNRVLSPLRKDFSSYVEMLGLSENAEPVEMLGVSGGHRATDNFEVFPKIVRQPDGCFSCRFFLHGGRHANPAAMERVKTLHPGETLYVTIELTNPATALAVQIQTEDYYMIGWAPRYLVGDLVKAIAESPGNYTARVVRVNPAPAPSKQRLLVELRGHWPSDGFMSAAEFEPLSN